MQRDGRRWPPIELRKIAFGFESRFFIFNRSCASARLADYPILLNNLECDISLMDRIISHSIFFSCCFHATPSEMSSFSMRPACRGRQELHVRQFAETSLAPLRLICMSRVNPSTLVQISPPLLQDACARASICKPAKSFPSSVIFGLAS